jgi:peptidoglycan-associated lipoprotein
MKQLGSILVSCTPLPSDPNRINTNDCAIVISAEDKDTLTVGLFPDKEKGGMKAVLASKYPFPKDGKIQMQSPTSFFKPVQVSYSSQDPVSESNLVNVPPPFYTFLMHVSYEMEQKHIPKTDRVISLNWSKSNEPDKAVILDIASIIELIDFLQNHVPGSPPEQHQLTLPAEIQKPNETPPKPSTSEVTTTEPAEPAASKEPAAEPAEPHTLSEPGDEPTQLPESSEAEKSKETQSATETTLAPAPKLLEAPPIVSQEKQPEDYQSILNDSQVLEQVTILIPKEVDKFSDAKSIVAEDRNTGLIWTRTDPSVNNGGPDPCDALEAGGYDDWRIPTPEELSRASAFLSGESTGFCLSGQENGISPVIVALEQTFKPIYFDYNKYDLRIDQLPVIQEEVRLLMQVPNIKIVIEGHCDERGTDEYNLALGEGRAEIVKNYVVGLGIDPERIITITYGEAKPSTSGHDEASWARNRRVQFHIITEQSALNQ